MVFRVKTVQQSKTICKICSVTFKYSAGLTSSMNAHLKRQHSIDEESEVLDSKTVKTSLGTRVREFSLLQETLCLFGGHACAVNM